MLELEFIGAVLFNPFDKNKNIALTKNPDDYNRIYFQELINYDFLTDRLITVMKPVRLKNYGILTPEQKYYYNESQKIRPFGDTCYFPSLYNSITKFLQVFSVL